MLRNLYIVLVSLSLGFCSFKKDQSSSSLKNNQGCLLKEIFTANQIQFLLEQDSIDYLARLSLKELIAFDPENQITNLDVLSRDVRQVLAQNYPANYEAIMRREIEIDQLIFNQLNDKLKKWVYYRKIEITMRTGQEYLGIDSDSILTQQFIRPWIEAKLDTFNPLVAFNRYLPDMQSRELLIRENVTLSEFVMDLNRSITNQTDTDSIRAWMRSARIWKSRST